MSDELNPITREEAYLNAIAEGSATDLKPITRKEMFLAHAAGQDVIPPAPVTREEMFLAKISGGAVHTEAQTYIVVDENGTEIAAVETGESVPLTATANDIRLGTTAATDDGVVAGTKDIPAYHTTEGIEEVLPGEKLTIFMFSDKCQYTKLQAVVCTYNTSISDSVSTEKVSIDGKVYAVNSTTVLSEVVVDEEQQTINLSLTNENTNSVLIRYFTYKEEI